MGPAMELAATKTTTWIIQPERALTAFLFFSLFYFSYLYFFPFDQGISAAPAAVKAAKDGVYAILLLALAPSFRFTKDWREWIFVPLVVALLITSVIHGSHTDLKEQIWQNIKNIAIFIPIYHIAFQMDRSQRDRLTFWTFTALIFAAITQSIFSFAFDWTGGKLWADHVFAGLIGNPNSFSLVLNLAFGVVLAFIPSMSARIFIASLAMIALLFVTILHTTSGSQAAIFVLLIPYAAIVMRAKWHRFLAVALIVAAAIVANQRAVDNTTYSVSGITEALQEEMPNTELLAEQLAEAAPEQEISSSVTTRVRIVRLAISVFENPADAVFGSFSTDSYTPMDGQFFVFLYNGGLLLLLSLAAPAALIYLQSLMSVWRTRNQHEAALHFMLVAFGITFLPSRILMYYPLNFIFFMVCGLIMAAIHRNRYQS